MRLDIWKVSTLVLAGSLVVVTGSNLVRDASAEPQPHMKSALEHLEQAKAALERATADKGGHRVKAIEATKLAIEETKAGVEFDDKH